MSAKTRGSAAIPLTLSTRLALSAAAFSPLKALAGRTADAPRPKPGPLVAQPDTKRISAGPQGRNEPGAAIRLTDVSKSFGKGPVIANLSLAVDPGQFVAVVGRSGCGKSTLLRLIAGLERPDAGDIALSRPDGNGPRTRIMFQEHRLLPWAHVAENVDVGLEPGTGLSSRRERIARALAEVGLQNRGNDWPSVLSGGQRQRVALARALVSTPDLLLFDEPLGALDALTRLTMQSLISRLWRQTGFTALLVTHDVAEAVLLADRVIVLDQGRIALDLAIDQPHPRKPGSPQLAALEQHLLSAIFGASEAGL